MLSGKVADLREEVFYLLLGVFNKHPRPAKEGTLLTRPSLLMPGVRRSCHFLNLPRPTFSVSLTDRRKLNMQQEDKKNCSRRAKSVCHIAPVYFPRKSRRESLSTHSKYLYLRKHMVSTMQRDQLWRWETTISSELHGVSLPCKLKLEFAATIKLGKMT